MRDDVGEKEKRGRRQQSDVKPDFGEREKIVHINLRNAK